MTQPRYPYLDLVVAFPEAFDGEEAMWRAVAGDGAGAEADEAEAGGAGDWPSVQVPSSAMSAQDALLEDWGTELFAWGAGGVEHRDADTLVPPAEAGYAEGGMYLKGPDGAAPPSKGGQVVRIIAHFAEEQPAREALASFASRPGVSAAIAFVEGDAWRDTWRNFFRPLRPSEGLWVRPPWWPSQASAGEVELIMDPGRAFGSGMHESTQLVLARLTELVSKDAEVLDVGTGSGILGIAALKLGASRVLAVDNDPDALPVAEENASVNGVAARFSVVCAASPETIAPPEKRFDLVLANIQSSVLESMVSALRARVAEGGALVLSGILVEELDRIQHAFSSMQWQGDWQQGSWAAVVLRLR